MTSRFLPRSHVTGICATATGTFMLSPITALATVDEPRAPLPGLADAVGVGGPGGRGLTGTAGADRQEAHERDGKAGRPQREEPAPYACEEVGGAGRGRATGCPTGCPAAPGSPRLSRIAGRGSGGWRSRRSSRGPRRGSARRRSAPAGAAAPREPDGLVVLLHVVPERAGVGPPRPAAAADGHDAAGGQERGGFRVADCGVDPVQRVERDDGAHRGVVGVVPVLEGAWRPR